MEVILGLEALVASLVGHLGSPEGLLEALRDHLGSLEGYLGDLEGHLGAKEAAKGQDLDFALFFCWCLVRACGQLAGSWSHLEGLEGHLGRSWVPSWWSGGPIWEVWWAILEVLRACLRPWGTILEVWKVVWETVSAILGRRRLPRAKILILHLFVDGCWPELGDNWLGLGAIWRVWRAILGGLGGHLGKQRLKPR